MADVEQPRYSCAVCGWRTSEPNTRWNRRNYARSIEVHHEFFCPPVRLK